MKQYRTTFSFLLTCVGIQVACLLLPDLTERLAFNPNGGIAGWLGLMTYALDHAGWGHLVGNFVFGLPFLLYLEYMLGSDRLVQYLFLTAMSSALVHYFVSGGVILGSSGVMFGVMAGACVTWGEGKAQHLLGLGYLLLLVLEQLMMANDPTYGGIAFYGHVGGALGGALLAHRLYKPKAS